MSVELTPPSGQKHHRKFGYVTLQLLFVFLFLCTLTTVHGPSMPPRANTMAIAL